MKSIREIYKIGKGPSSSHTMGPERAARLFLRRYPQATSFRATLYGSRLYYHHAEAGVAALSNCPCLVAPSLGDNQGILGTIRLATDEYAR